MKKLLFPLVRLVSLDPHCRVWTYVKARFCALLLYSSFCAIALPSFAQSPAMSRGEQLLPITNAECMRRAPLALQAEGFDGISAGGNYTYGRKAIHGVYIVCNPAPEGKTWVNIVVASVATDGGVPGTERVRLQQRMERPEGTGGGDGGGNTVQANWGTQPNQLQGTNGQRFTLACPGGGTLSGRLWGTDLYTDDSSICTAAVHAGIISVANGGTVTIELRPGAGSYKSSTRNGVTSQDYGAWGGSFVFVGGGNTVQANWGTQPNQLQGTNGQRFTLACPGGGTLSSRLWGTDLYTDDSSICTAAVHAGIISVANGGTVTIELRPGAGSYKSSTRNGVTSQDYGAWGGSFVFVGGSR